MSKNWLDNICVGHVKRCSDCPPGTECCREHDKKSGKQGNVLSCTAPNSCNQSTGHATNKASVPCPLYREGYNGSSTGNENNNCDNWKWAMVVLIFVALVFASGFIIMSVRYSKVAREK